jgi:FkbM family methyltransferase
MLVEQIDFDYILTVIAQVVEANRKENLLEIEKQTLNSEKDVVPYGMLDFSYNKMVCLNFLQYCLQNKAQLQLNLNLFESEEDRVELLSYIYNNIYVALSNHNPPPKSDYIEQRAKYNAFLSGIRQDGANYTLTTTDRSYTLPINHFEKVVFYHNYGLDALPAAAQERLAGSDFIDAGAYIGDTALVLNQYRPRRIHAFEPCSANLELLNRTLQLNGISNVQPVPKALSNAESTLRMFAWNNASFLTEEGNQQVQTTTIDNYTVKNGLNVGLVKMDIEGAESSAIQGAEQTIRMQKPTMVISLYHTGRDFFEIPELLRRWVPSYRFRFLNLHRLAPILERVLLAYPES